jgi:Flp pilus assembly pilin Flp
MSVYGLGGFHPAKILAFRNPLARFHACDTEWSRQTHQRPVAAGRLYAPIPMVCDGQGLVEFAFILMLVALACVASVVAFGTALDGYYAAIISGLPF